MQNPVKIAEPDPEYVANVKKKALACRQAREEKRQEAIRNMAFQRMGMSMELVGPGDHTYSVLAEFAQAYVDHATIAYDHCNSLRIPEKVYE